jgi:hypothetical protein
MTDSLKELYKPVLRIFQYRYVPVYIRWPKRIPVINKFSPSLFYILLGPVLFIPYMIIKYTVGNNNDDLLAISLCIAIISAAGVLMVNGYLKVVETMLLFTRLLTEKKQYKLLLKDLYIIFKSPLQNIFSFSFGILGFVVVFLMNPNLSKSMEVYCYLLAFLAFVLAGYGLWMAIASLHWIYNLRHYGSFNLFPIPGKTLALINLSKLIGVFSLSFSLEVGLFLVALFAISWQNNLTYAMTVYFFGLPFVIFTFIYFILPQYFIKNIVYKKKIELILKMEDCLKDIDHTSFIKDHNNVDYLNYIQSLTLHNDLVSSPSFPIHINTFFKFIISITIPVIVFVFQRFILNFFK